MRNLKDMSNAIRFLSMDAVEKAKSGHPGMPMGMADVATILFSEFLKFNPKDEKWANRDRFILSAGHGSMLLYSLLHLTGYPSMTLDEIKNFRQWNSLTPGHPEYGHTPGVETTTGPLGQGLATAVGMALGERLMAARVGEEVINHKTYVICGDGDLMEGISQEAISFAGHLKLKNLIVLFDDNGITIDGKTDLSTSENHLKRFEACGWYTTQINGHDFDEIRKALKEAQNQDKPVLIACKTVIAMGAPTKAGTSASHGSPLGADEIQKTRAALNWSYAPFEIPEEIRKAWQNVGLRCQEEYKGWQDKFTKLSKLHKDSLTNEYNLTSLNELENFKKSIFEEKPNLATRVLSERVLNVATQEIPQLVGGSADLTPSNNTKAKEQKPVSAHSFEGSYIYYGIREHGMAAIMNGLSLYGGFIPYGGTFLVFSDYLKPSLRLAALMGIGPIYVFTHDSIGLGEDGPTHQPIEHLTSLRAIPNVNVFRPCDAAEVIECWQIALQNRKTPSILALTRQNLPFLRQEQSHANVSNQGGYILKDAQNTRQLTIIASGSEVHLGYEAQKILSEKGIDVALVSMPCIELFEKQEASYKAHVLGKAPRIIIEAGCSMSWHRYLRENDEFIGIDHFGASAPAPVLFEKFGITVDSIVKAAERMI